MMCIVGKSEGIFFLTTPVENKSDVIVLKGLCQWTILKEALQTLLSFGYILNMN